MALHCDEDVLHVNIWQTFIHTGTLVTLQSVIEVLTALTSLRRAI